MISKSTFIRGIQCLKSFYLHKKRPFLRDPLSAEMQKKFQRGHDVGIVARNLFPDGIEIVSTNPKAYKKNTELLRNYINDKTPVLYEAPFYKDDLLAIMDILCLESEQWKAYEVKSSVSITDTYLWDITFQAYVIRLFGLENCIFFLIHINPEYIRKDSLQLHQLFAIKQVDDEIEKRIGLIPPLILKMKEIEKQEKSPEINIGQHCFQPYKCDFFGYCWKHVPKPSVFNIPGLSLEKKFSLLHEGKSDLMSALPYISDAKQKNFVNAWLRKELIIQTQLIENILPANSDNILFFKLIAIADAIPPFPDTKPFQTIPIIISVRYNNNQNAEQHFIFSPAQNIGFSEAFFNFWNTFVSFAKDKIIICFGDSLILLSIAAQIEETIKLKLNELNLFDLQTIFANGMYCAPDIDEFASYSSVVKHFADSEPIYTDLESATQMYPLSFSNLGSDIIEKVKAYNSDYLFNISIIYHKLYFKISNHSTKSER